jgi:hydroxymethylbilane synthase
MKKIIKLATRNSPLALKQADLVKQIMSKNCEIKIVPMTSSGDTVSKNVFKQHGGKGLFLKELEESLLSKKCDIAVHSLKDVPATLNNKFRIVSISEREDSEDALISENFNCIDELPKNAIIGTSSPRRISMLKKYSSNFKIVEIRGNIQTRLKKMKDQKIDAIILAAAGLHRMGLKDRIKQYLPLDDFIPSAGQGILCIEYLESNYEIERILTKHTIEKVQICAEIERNFIKALDGDCMSPIGVHAKFKKGIIEVCAFVSDIDGKNNIRTKYKNTSDKDVNTGVKLADIFIKQGARKLLSK